MKAQIRRWYKGNATIVIDLGQKKYFYYILKTIWPHILTKKTHIFNLTIELT